MAVALPIAGLWGLSGRLVSSASAPRARDQAVISPWVHEGTAGGARADLLVVLKEQADLGPALSLPTKAERGRWVYEALRRTAERSQAPLRAWLEARQVRYRPFYIVNMIYVPAADRSLVEALASRPEAARIEANPRILGVSPESATLESGYLAPEGVEWNLLRVNADDVWAMGYTGQGVVVGGQDTGYEWDHPALVAQYREAQPGYGRHDYNWHDAIHANDPHTAAGNPCGFDSLEPCDDNGHGTHSMGIAVGDDGDANQVGVAPGARWIGCRNMEQGWGTPASYLECFEFFLAPYPTGGNPGQGEPALAPDITTNSWTCPPEEGCAWDILQNAVEAHRAAGILTVVSAGNDGYGGCSTVSKPPAIYDATYTVGATDSGDYLAWYSSRGPVVVDGSHRLKPDIVAPGSNIRSSVPGGEYGFNSGTSMAAPHVAGAVALLWSALPALAHDLQATEVQLNGHAYAIVSSACSSDGVPNNLYGWGRLDAFAAVCATVGDVSFRPAPATAGETLTLTGTVIAGILPVTYTWDLGDASELLAGNPITYVYSTPGLYPVSLSLDNICPDSTVITRTVAVWGSELVYLPLVMRSEGS